MILSAAPSPPTRSGTPSYVVVRSSFRLFLVGVTALPFDSQEIRILDTCWGGSNS